MSIISVLWDYIVPFLFILTVLVYVHEMGHYLIARHNGVRVEAFSIGFGPEIYGWTNKAGTRWKIGAVPLGGYVKMFGESEIESGEPDMAEMTVEEKAVSFYGKRLGQRAAIVVAGPIANFIFAILVFAALYSTIGRPRPLAVVGRVMAQSAAEKAGFKSGDLIVDINGETIAWFEDLRRVVSANPGVRLSFGVRRGDAKITLAAAPKLKEIDEGGGNTRRFGQLGVGMDISRVGYERLPIFKAAWLGVERTYSMSARILAYLGEIIAGKRGAGELGGPIRIAQLSGQMAQGGPFNLFFFMAALSVNLGLINLFPIPMLDGGHLAFYAVEAVRGRPLGARVQEYGFRFGLILVFLLMIFATWNDLVQLKVIEFLKELIT
ncbi:MAG TPA: RIP metalloprotease RseP [Alphaproteobacteria bacterium]|nr:RIP metalloprotease RseP [Alphaproteobacteria bacterium]